MSKYHPLEIAAGVVGWLALSGFIFYGLFGILLEGV